MRVIIAPLQSTKDDGSAIHLPATSRKAPIPLEIRIELFERVKRLRRRGLSYSKIRKVLAENYGYTPSKSLLSEWLRGLHSPVGSANLFGAEPTPELAYVIGVKLGDGSINRKGYNRRIRLQSIDQEFVMEFDRCLSKILHTRRHRLWADKRRREIHIEARSVLLYNFLRQSLDDFKGWIEYSPQSVASFLRGFFDSEGSTSKDGSLRGFNSDTNLLRYVQCLLTTFFKIETTGPHLVAKVGSVMIRRGHRYLRRQNVYEIYVRREGLDNFSKNIGFTIRRKSGRLNGVLQP